MQNFESTKAQSSENLVNIPKPYPDEHALGWRGRIKFFNHHPTIAHTIKELRTSYRKHHPGFKKWESIPQVVSLAFASGLPLKEFIKQHTLMPFSRAFGDGMEIELASDKSNYLLTKYGISVAKKRAWYCTSCIEQDSARYGVSYWHRAHQLLGVNWCPLHRHKLRCAEGHGALNEHPADAKQKHAIFVPPGPELLDEAELPVQRFVAISLMLLNSQRSFDLPKVKFLIELQFCVQQHADLSATTREQRAALQTVAPGYWIDQFVELPTYSAAFSFLDFKRLFVRSMSNPETERYVIAMAMLFNSAEMAIKKLEQSDEIRTPPVRDRQRTSQDLWWSEQVLNEYARQTFMHRHPTPSGAADIRSASDGFLDYALPNSAGQYDLGKRALRDFFSGKSLFEVSKSHGINQLELEKALRIAAERLGRAVMNMPIQDQADNLPHHHYHHPLQEP